MDLKDFWILLKCDDYYESYPSVYFATTMKYNIDVEYSTYSNINVTIN